MPQLEANSKVRYKSQPEKIGWVVGIEGNNARIFMDGSVKLIPLGQLEAVPRFIELNPTSFRISMTKRRLEHPLTDQLLSFRASRTKLYYNQFLPVKKILESPDQRLLIAD